MNDTHGILKLNDIVQNTEIIDGAAKEQYMEVMYMGFLINQVARQLIIYIIETKKLNINEVEAVDMSAYKKRAV